MPGRRSMFVWLLDPPLMASEGDVLCLLITGATPGPALWSMFRLLIRSRPARVRCAKRWKQRVCLPSRARIARRCLSPRYGSRAGGFDRYSRCSAKWLKCLRRQGVGAGYRCDRTDRHARVLPRRGPGGLKGRDRSTGYAAFPLCSSRRGAAVATCLWICALDRLAAEPARPARVFVNRLWKQFFGGIAAAVEDDVDAPRVSRPCHSGVARTALVPSFRITGWDIKRHREADGDHVLHLSSGFPASSPELRPKSILQNRYWFALAVAPRARTGVRPRQIAPCRSAGLFNHTTDLGGPSRKPYQPPGYYADIQFPDRDYVPEPRRPAVSPRESTLTGSDVSGPDARRPRRPVAARNASASRDRSPNTPQQAAHAA